MHDQEWYFLTEFFSRPWFSRAWVVQEAVVNARDPTCLCGNYTFPFSDVFLVAEVLLETQLRDLVPKRNFAFNISMIEAFRKNRLSFFKMLTCTISFASTDPRDRIFALLGIFSDAEEPIRNDQLLTVSYEKTSKEVSRDLARAYTKYYRNVGLLGWATGPGVSNIVGLPSWVPDWSAPRSLRRISLLHPLDPFNETLSFDASGVRQSIFVDTVDPDVLGIVGKVVDEVVWVQDYDETRTNLETLPQLRRPRAYETLWKEVSSRLGDTYWDGTEMGHAFWRTLIANQDKLRQPVGQTITFSSCSSGGFRNSWIRRSMTL
jgi:hypothetical protein